MSAALPPLPPPELIFFDAALQSPVEGYTISQTRAYAQQARADLESENKRLREALNKIACDEYTLWGAVNTARAALEKQP